MRVVLARRGFHLISSTDYIGLQVMKVSKVACNGSYKIHIARFQLFNLAGHAIACLDINVDRINQEQL